MDDLIKKGLEKAINKSKPIKNLTVVDKETKTVTFGKKDWNKLVRAMKTEHASRFNEVLRILPPRDFVKAYLTALEFFVPKQVRMRDSGSGKEDNKLEVVINRNKKAV